MTTIAPASAPPVATGLEACQSLHARWSSGIAPRRQLEALFDLVRRGPFSESGRPIRVLFLQSDSARGLLRPHLVGPAAETFDAAPVLMVLAELRPLYATRGAAAPLGDAPARFAKPSPRFALKRELYFLMAARSVGLEAGPMSLLDDPRLDIAFFPDGSAQVTALCGLGRDPADPQRFNPGLTPRSRCEFL